MATIKGQNLRIIINGKCVAASTGCTLHIATEVQDASTKDTVGGWQENIVVGNSWDASVDSLVIIPEPIDEGLLTAVEEASIPGGGITYACWLCDGLIDIPKGCTLYVTSDSDIFLVIDDEVVDNSTSGSLTYTPEDDAQVQIALASENDTASYIVPDTTAVNPDDLIGRLGGALVDVRFSLASGAKNRVESDTIVSGKARVTDISINAANRQLSTFSTQLTGSGSLEIEE